MNYIEKMLQDYCPNGVEWKELGEVCEFKRGQSLTSKKAVAGDVPVISGGQKPAFMHNTPNREGETIVVAGSGAYAGFVSYWDKPIFVSDAFSVDIKNLHEVSVRYVFHFLLNNQQKIYATKSGAGIPHVYGKNIAKFLIPIPPLKIQEEIVQILDKFTEYVTELTAELTDRQKQYSFYRDKLLSFEDEVYQVEWKTLGELFEFKNGLNKGKEFFGRGTPIVNYTDVYKNIRLTSAVVRGTVEASPEEQKRYNVRRGDVFFTRTSETKEEIGKTSVLLEDIDGGVFSGFVLRARPKTDSLLPEYCAHCFNSSSFRKEIVRYSTYTTRALTNGSTLAKLTIPLPPLPIQERIVQVLDNFDAVCNDLNIGLPKEIELRQKQYEYFREKLLTFTAEGVYPGQWTVDSERGPSDLIRLLQWVFGTIRVELGAICTFTRGNGLQKKDFTEEGYPVIHYGQIYTRYGFSTEKTISFTDQSVFAKLKKAQPGDIVMATTSENVEDVGKAVVWEGIEEVGISGDAYIVKTTQHSRFLNYFFKSIHFQEQKEKKVTGTKVIRINAQDMEKFIIALPSLEYQSRIVAILGKFDELTNSISQGLPKEIELRQKQYEYFRDTLFNFPNKYE
ncbi:restriction endonuclease subunit S [Streptococcus suis]|uniref:restriction endonuclease subunit S n=1 Tax=Streptococcus suis TaxID=1307 RepID=UPI0005CF2206|nr:restriction endonuclease subunit S [Streptococcus suis]NQH80516.1 restriction endonuclease subunit S [Streptococcus suis]CYU51465.1 type I restriction-modification system S protein [Streptococcus suis]